MSSSTHDATDPVDDGLADPAPADADAADPTPPTDPGAGASDGSTVSPDDPGAGTVDGDPTPADETDPAALPPEIGGQKGPEPTRYGDWEKKGRCTDF